MTRGIYYLVFGGIYMRSGIPNDSELGSIAVAYTLTSTVLGRRVFSVLDLDPGTLFRQKLVLQRLLSFRPRLKTRLLIPELTSCVGCFRVFSNSLLGIHHGL